MSIHYFNEGVHVRTGRDADSVPAWWGWDGPEVPPRPAPPLAAAPVADLSHTGVDHQPSEAGPAHDLEAPPAAPTVDPAVVQLAVCFAVDYCSWDEDCPTAHRIALCRYLAPGASAAVWDGRGRQGATQAYPGRSEPGDSPGLWWVHVRVLVTRYQRAARPALVRPVSPIDLAGRPSSVPVPDDPQWRAVETAWVDLEVPIRELSSGEIHVQSLTRPSDVGTASTTEAPAAAPEPPTRRAAPDSDDEPTDRHAGHGLVAVRVPWGA